ncbi:M23 family metallopeptidase [Campylobacter sp. US33a]|uniref:M23 family metallopeptidase n=1 Tax=Campylobacter sp. CCS1377 TaxID=3158229 RepID=A0AAU7E8P5_9BACT|nr:M23 family metallopeptidase [Campylobacter sp. US33a]TEY04583.1 M23 family metallopeptidase [Campylobacter sp. US33a]
MLKNKFTITITDINGSKHFYLSQIIKKIVLYIVGFVFVFLIFSGFYIHYLDSKVMQLTQKKQELMDKRQELSLINKQMQESIEQKAQEYAAIEDKITSLEERLGLEIENNLSIAQRLETLRLTNEQQLAFLTQIPSGWPIENKGMTGKYGWREHPILDKREFHPGIDLRAEIGTPIYAPANGVVEYAGYNNGYGYLVILLHNFGFKSVFAHMMQKNVVSIGQFVNKGDLIGYTGNSGLSTGPHLHYEIRFVNKTLEPLNFMNLERKNINEIFNQERRVPWQSLINQVSLAQQYQQKQP